MAERRGTIVSLDPQDALGWIQLDDGERVRVGGAALSCDGHGEMQQLLCYDGGQFLDGALHVFVCRDRACNALSFVAEF